MKKSYLLKSVFICCFVVLGGWMIDNFLISEAKTQVQLSDDSYNCQGCKCGRPYEADSCVHGDVGICCSMIQALEDEQLETNFGNYVIDDNLKDLDLLGDPISLSFEIQCVDAAGNKIDESNCNPTTKPTSCDIPDVTPTDKYYTVKFDCNEGSNPPIDQSFKVGESKALNANTCTRTDYAFQGWSKTKGGTKAYDDKATVNLGGTAGATITLYAVWTYSPGTYTVKFDCNGGSNAPASQSFTVGESKTLNANTCTRTDYTFQGWSTTKGGNKEYNDKANVNPGGTAGSTVNLYAVWVDEQSGCPAPTITKVEGKSVSFTLNTDSSNVNAVILRDAPNSTSVYESDGGSKVSPRVIKANYDDGYVKLQSVCKDGTDSPMSNIESFGNPPSCYFPRLYITGINECAIYYDMKPYNPLDRTDLDWQSTHFEVKSPGSSSFYPCTTSNFKSPFKCGVSESTPSGVIRIRYKHSGCEGYSTEYYFDMSKQTNCGGSSGGSSSSKKQFYNGKCLNWKNNGLYDSNGKLITTISGWKRMGNGYDVRYNSYQSPHWVIWFDNDTTTWGSYSDAYLDYYSDFSKILSAGYSFPLTVYHPGTSNQRHKIVLSSTGYTQSVTQYNIGNLYSSTCTN